MKEVISALLSIIGGSIIGVFLTRILNSMGKTKWNIVFTIIGLLICIGNLIFLC